MSILRQSQLAAGVMAALLSACGGGGGGSAPVTPSLTLTGTAATGAAIAGAPVQVKCASGTGSATSAADGRYTVEIAAGSLPCALTVQPAGGSALHSVIEGSGPGTVTVNISPLTELVVARLAGGTPADLVASFDSAAQAKVTRSRLDAAIVDVAAALQGTIDLAGVDPLKDALAVGNALDQKLDALNAALAAARTSLADVAAALAAGGDASASVGTMLQPAAANCAGLRSGRYAWLSPVENDPSAPGYAFVTIDAAVLTVGYRDGAGVDHSAMLTDDGSCTYSGPVDAQGSSKFLVSSSGITIKRDTDSSGPQAGLTFVGGILVPLQAIPLAELAGTWNVMKYYRETVTTAFAAGRATMVVDGAGKLTALTGCDSAGMCQERSIGNNGDGFTANADGGFDIGGSATEASSRAFAYKAADGSLSMFMKYSGGRGFMILAKQAALPLPDPGTVSNYWDVSFTSSGSSPTLVEQSTTVTAVDAAAGTYTRTSTSRIDRYKVDDPQAGMRSRAANSCTTPAGAALACSGIVAMPLPGTGITSYFTVAPQNDFGITIARP